VTEDRATLEPLRARPGARFTCHGDGLCCTDVHAFGPVSDDEAEVLLAIHEKTLSLHQGKSRVITTNQEGGCIFHAEGRCQLHVSLGAASKPQSCRQFPFMLVATPTGGRIVTEHRCPCRTLGERGEITGQMALESHGDAPSPDRTIRSRVLLTDDEEIEFEEWERLEAPMLARLEAGEDALAVLGARPLEPRDPWLALGTEFTREEDPSRFGAAIRRFGATLLRLLDAPEAGDVDEHLPWGEAFDRAEARSPDARDPERMLADWVADALWSTEWAFTSAFSRARTELATRIAVAREVAAELGRAGARPDRAMAEAIAVVELAGLADDYQDLVPQLPEAGPLQTQR
jgi:hypothetical protein